MICTLSDTLGWELGWAATWILGLDRMSKVLWTKVLMKNLVPWDNSLKQLLEAISKHMIIKKPYPETNKTIVHPKSWLALCDLLRLESLSSYVLAFAHLLSSLASFHLSSWWDDVLSNWWCCCCWDGTYIAVACRSCGQICSDKLFQIFRLSMIW